MFKIGKVKFAKNKSSQLIHQNVPVRIIIPTYNRYDVLCDVFKDLENPISARSIKGGEGIIEYFYGEESIFALGQDSENKVFVKIDELDSIQNGLLNIFSSVSQAPEIKDFDKKLDHFNKHSFYVYKSII